MFRTERDFQEERPGHYKMQCRCQVRSIIGHYKLQCRCPVIVINCDYSSFIYRPFKVIYSEAIPAQRRSNNVALWPERNRAEWATGVRRSATARPLADQWRHWRPVILYSPLRLSKGMKASVRPDGIHW